MIIHLHYSVPCNYVRLYKILHLKTSGNYFGVTLILYALEQRLCPSQGQAVVKHVGLGSLTDLLAHVASSGHKLSRILRPQVHYVSPVFSLCLGALGSQVIDIPYNVCGCLSTFR